MSVMLSIREYMEASADHRPLTPQEQADAITGNTDLEQDPQALPVPC
jgi:hypothetical protein